MGILIVPALGSDETVETYATKVFKEWGIGDEKMDTGLLLLISVEDRKFRLCLLYTSPSPRDRTRSRMPSSA